MRPLRNLTLTLALSLGGVIGIFPATAQAETITILALGDSLTAGYGLPEGEGLVPQLQAWLNAEGADAAVINAGVSGDTTAGGLSRLGWSMTPEVDAMIVNLGGNDLLRGVAPEESRANLDAILKDASGRGLPILLVGLPAPGNFGPDYKADFDAIYPELSASYDTLLLPDYFAPLRASGDPAPFMQADGIHPNRDGVAKIVTELGPKVMELLARANADAP